jgi:hypothetical protein
MTSTTTTTTTYVLICRNASISLLTFADLENQHVAWIALRVAETAETAEIVETVGTVAVGAVTVAEGVVVEKKTPHPATIFIDSKSLNL